MFGPDDLAKLAQSVFGPKCRALGTTYSAADLREQTTIVIAELAFADVPLPERRVVLKLADANSAYPPFAREAAIQRRVVRETDIPACAVLAVDDSCRHFPQRYFMMDHAPGMQWRDGLERMSPSNRYLIYRQFGKAVAALHSLSYPHFGEVVEHSSDSPLPRSTGSGVRSDDYLSALVARARRRIANPAHADLFEAVLQAHAGDFAAITEPRLTHEDLNPSNLLVVPGDDAREGWHLSAVLDFGSAWAGCPESDIARLDLWRDMMGDGFREGYTAHRPIAENYATRRPVYQLLWCLEYARPTPIHHADTARVCAELGIPPVTFG